MTELLELIKSNYLQRTADIGEQKKIWTSLSGQFRPDLTLYRTGRPSMLIAKETGDLGLSVLWIVQAALIRPILKDIVLKSENDKELSSMLSRVDHNSLCALAHSENSAAPVILTESGDGFKVTGEKKFVTAGKSSDLMIVSCRMPGDAKISRIAVIDPTSIADDSLPDLKLEILNSVSHTRLHLSDTFLKHFQIPRINPSEVRRMLKKWAILERSLIVEAFLAFLLYAEKILIDAGAEISESEEIYSIIETQSDSVTKQIDEGTYSDRIETENIPIQKLFLIVDTFKKAYSKVEGNLSEAERVKLKDVFLFDNFKG